jgi:regulator of sigma E protease
MQPRVFMPPILWKKLPMPLESPNILVTLFAFVLLLGTLVTIHELGHYCVGRWFGVKAEKFSIGFGPQIWGRVDKRGTLWRVAAFPLGGFVQFAGDMNPAGQPDAAWHALPEDERNQTFQSKPLYQRALIVFAGPAVNFLLAIAIFMGFLLAYGQSVTPAKVESVITGSPADRAGIQLGDRIVSVNGHSIDNFQELIGEVVMIPNERAVIVVERNGSRLTLTTNVAEKREVDRFGNTYRIGQIGIASPQSTFEDVSVLQAPGAAIAQTFGVVRQQIKGIGQIITGRRSIKELGGPLKIAQVSGQAMTMGILAFISLAALISINLGFINLLPIPMLDGGHLFLYAIEAVRRRPATPVVQEWAFRAGFALLVCFMVMVTINDLASFGLFGRG